jgi:hydroxyacylglutathione hydrolase
MPAPSAPGEILQRSSTQVEKARLWGNNCTAGAMACFAFNEVQRSTAMRTAFTAGIAILLLVQTAAFAGDERPQPAADKKEIEKLPGLYKVAGRGGDESAVYCVLTPEPVLIDCGSRVGWDQLAGNLKLLGLSPGDVRWVIATHGHWDHMDAMALFQKDFPSVKFAIHAGDAQFVINDDRVFSCAEPLYDGVESAPVKVDRVLLDNDTVNVGNAVFRIVHTPGHTPGCIVVATEIAGKKSAFSGDSVGGYYSLLNRSSTIDWQSSLKKIQALDVDWLCTGHGRDPVDSKDEIREMIDTQMQAVTSKRKKQESDEPYRGLESEMNKGR